MRLLDKALIKRFAEVGRQDEVRDPLVIARFYNLVGRGSWWATEYYPETKEFFGYVSLLGDECDEWGYFSQNELENYFGPFGYQIVRDLVWEEQPATKAIPGFTGFGK